MILSNIKDRVNMAAIKATVALSTPAEETKPESKASRRAKKVVSIATTMAVAASMMAVTVFAAPTLSGAELTFFTEALGVLKTVLVLIGAGVGIWGIVNLLEGYGNDNPGAKSQGMKQLMAGIGVALVGIFAPNALETLIKGSAGSGTTT